MMFFSRLISREAGASGTALLSLSLATSIKRRKKERLNLLGEAGYFSKSSKDSKSLEDFSLINL